MAEDEWLAKWMKSARADATSNDATDRRKQQQKVKNDNDDNDNDNNKNESYGCVQHICP